MSQQTEQAARIAQLAAEVTRLTARGDLWKGAHKKAEERYVRDEDTIARVEALVGDAVVNPVPLDVAWVRADKLEETLASVPEEGEGV